MVKKENNFLKNLGIFLLILLIVLFLFSKLATFELPKFNIEKRIIDALPDETLNSETLTISGTNNIKTINLPGKNIKLIVSGLGNLITITKNTNLQEITISGTNNEILLCQNVHFPTITESGIGNDISYIEC